MSERYILSCESTVDLPFSYINSRDISVLFYTYMIDGKEFTDNMGRDEEALAEFYRFIKEGSLPTTSQINTYRYIEYFENLILKGDIIHIAFGSGMTPSVTNAREAAELVRARHPERRLIVIDSLASSVGYGLLVESAADLRDSGADIDLLEKWVLDHRLNVHHQFFSTDLTMFKRSGRVSGPSAMIGTVLGICPIMHLNEEGRIIAYDKVRGKKAAINRTVETIAKNFSPLPEYGDKCYIGHSNAIELAEMTSTAIQNKIPALQGKVTITDIGTIIASHCGPGTIAVFFYGVQR